MSEKATVGRFVCVLEGGGEGWEWRVRYTDSYLSRWDDGPSAMAIGAGEDMAEEAKAKGEGCVLVEGQSKDRNAQLWLDINPLGKQVPHS